MKRLTRPDLFMWSRFDDARDMDFNSLFWVREEGNLVIDPLPLSPHDARQLEERGGVKYVLLTNSDHIRGTEELVKLTGAEVLAPAGEKDRFPIHIDGWLEEGDALIPGIKVIALHGSKTPGELALMIEDRTLVTGDLIRGPVAGTLDTLPTDKLSDPEAALESIVRLSSMVMPSEILPGDGWQTFSRGAQFLSELIRKMRRQSSPVASSG